MHLNSGDIDRRNCIANRDAGVRVGRRIDEDRANLIRLDRSDRVDNLALMV